jgi:hypothetical protein
METTFSQIIGSWHDFYVTIATASATLVGLLFVAVSLHIDVLSEENVSNAQVVARETFSHFIFIIGVALVFLVPDQTPAGLGIPISIIGLIELALAIRISREAWRAQKASARAPDLSNLPWRILLPQLGYVVMVAIGLTIVAGQTAGLGWLFPVILLLLSGAAASAWNLMVSLAAVKRDHTK